jgi:hypothetical protein
MQRGQMSDKLYSGWSVYGVETLNAEGQCWAKTSRIHLKAEGACFVVESYTDGLTLSGCSLLMVLRAYHLHNENMARFEAVEASASGGVPMRL